MQPCKKCGQVHEKVAREGDDPKPTCTAHVRRDGEQRPCGNYPVHGATVCRFHGGAAPQTKAKAAEREAAAAMDRVLRFAIGEVDPKWEGMSPDEQLLMEVNRSAQAVEWLAAQVGELTVPDPSDTSVFSDVVGVDEEGNEIVRVNRFTLYGPDHNDDLGIHPLWKKLDEERDRHARFCKLAIDAGISERIVRLAESQAQQLVGIILAVIDGLGLGARQREDARRIAAAKLREIGPGGGVIEVPAR